MLVARGTNDTSENAMGRSHAVSVVNVDIAAVLKRDARSTANQIQNQTLRKTMMSMRSRRCSRHHRRELRSKMR